MYTDALQGTIMAVGMLILLVYGYSKVGGIVAGHQALTDLADLVPAKLKDMGHQGWTAMPVFGWGAAKYDMWWTVITTIVMGVGIGVLAQPQLAVRFMTVKSNRELNRAVATGGVFILLMTGVAFTVGALSNAYFALHGPLMTGRIVKTISAEKNHVVLQVMKEEGGRWIDVEGKQAPAVLDKDKPYLNAGFDNQGQTGKVAQGRSISVVNTKDNSSDQIIPTYITSAMPKWFGIVFLLTLLAAAMSTLSSQFHTLGTSIGRDVYEQVSGRRGKSVGVVRIGIILGLILAVSFSTYARSDYIIARATSIFFGLCASTFLPTFVGGLFFRRATKAGALASMIVGSLVTVFWLVFVKSQEAGAIGLVQKVTGGKTSILWNHPNWPVVDQLLIALPLSALALIVVSTFTRPPDGSHMARCFVVGAADKRNA
jgi:SSS family solute:Na+ symporter